MRKLRVMVVDDSAQVRQQLSRIIDAQPDMQVVGTASCPAYARVRLPALMPDVMTLDIELPAVVNLDFLRRLCLQHQMAVLLVSSLSAQGSLLARQASQSGGFSFVCKPVPDMAHGAPAYARMLSAKLREVAQARLPGSRRFLGPATVGSPPAPAAAPMRAIAGGAALARERVIVVGSSTGGTEAVLALLRGLPPDAPPVLIAQHMPPHFTRSFAQRLDRETPLSVSEAEDGQLLAPGMALVAPGDAHLLLEREQGGFKARLSQAERVNRHRPSVDVLFHSAALAAGRRALGVILTGMGKDGAIGLRALRDAGARTIAQDEASCVVFGMPRAAIELDAADEVLPLPDIAQHLMRMASTWR